MSAVDVSAGNGPTKVYERDLAREPWLHAASLRIQRSGGRQLESLLRYPGLGPSWHDAGRRSKTRSTAADGVCSFLNHTLGKGEGGGGGSVNNDAII